MRLLKEASRWLAALVVALCLFGTGQQAFAQECLALLTPNVIQRLGPEYHTALEIAQRSNLADEGIVVALRSRLANGDNADVLRDMIRRVPETAHIHLERLGKLGEKPGIGRLVKALSSSEENNIKGAQASLRYATDVLGPSKVRGFEEAGVPKTVPDIVDTDGNLFEVKHRDYANEEKYKPFIVEQDMYGIREQAEHAQVAAQNGGKNYTLVFEMPIPEKYNDYYNDIFGPLDALPHATVDRRGF